MQPERQAFRSESQSEQPQDELDVANHIVQPTSYDEVLEQVNLGTGYYGDADLELQMRSFRKGLIADVAFDGPLWERAKYETKIKIADEGFRYFYDEKSREPKSWDPFDDVADDWDCGRTQALRKRGDEIWDELSDPDKALTDEQAAAIAEKTGIQKFKPVFWRMMAAYHEASKSKGGRTQDNFFGRVKKHLLPDKNGNQGGGILSRGSQS